MTLILQVVLDNPTQVGNPFQFEITFECLQELEDGEWSYLLLQTCLSIGSIYCVLAARLVSSIIHFRFICLRLWFAEVDLEWKVIYVGSAEDSRHDQILEEVLVGPVPVGVNKFVLQSEPPNFTEIPENDVLGVTVVLVTCAYRDQEFVRVGYYVNNESCEEPLSAEEHEYPSRPLDFTKITRQILSDKPRVTRFPINWTNSIVTNHEDEKVCNANQVANECDEDVVDMEQEEDDEEDDGDSEDLDIDLEEASGEEEYEEN
jgi:histone chaperone ASF1